MKESLENIFSLKNKKILVTGASKGIGLAVAQGLHAFGATVTLVARGAEDLESAKVAMVKEGGGADRVELQPLDITDLARLGKFIATSPTFDGIVNSAGVNKPQPATMMSEENYDNTFLLNVKAAYFLTQYVVKKMMDDQVRGSIVHLSSQMGHIGGENRSVYCATKHAMEGFVKAMALEFGRHGIRINTVCPTFVTTPMTASMLDDQKFKERVLSQIALSRIAVPKDIVGAVIYLLSDAGAMSTGSALKVDGGWTAR